MVDLELIITYINDVLDKNELLELAEDKILEDMGKIKNNLIYLYEDFHGIKRVLKDDTPRFNENFNNMTDSLNKDGEICNYVVNNCYLDEDYLHLVCSDYELELED